ncbi:MAG: hypothetical protein Q4B54_11925 [Coriobacteriales bacterium]|nr:hypothetical protein [Coriobacteriales bacterium]
MSHITYVLCHGLNGCGQYDKKYRKKPYWGGASGDVAANWRAQGVDAVAASVAPQGSAWDRACELYAQLAGTRTDYGIAHCSKYHHGRFGRDFTGDPLIPSFTDDTRLVLIGHSFGGATIRLFGELLAHGSAAEREATSDESVSPLFAGGLDQRIHAIVTLAAPTNGTTAYDLTHDPNFDAKHVRIKRRYKIWDRVLKANTKIKADKRDARDWANFDMLLDNAQALNAQIATLPHVYYLSVACDATEPAAGGTRVPDTSLMDPLFVKTGTLMGCWSGTTEAGFEIDDAWHANDGLVNTVSAHAPFGAPQKELTLSDIEDGTIERGIWNILPDQHADHGFFQGGFIKKQDPQQFFQALLELLQRLD